MALVNYPKPPINEKLMRVVEKILAVDKTLKLYYADEDRFCFIKRRVHWFGIWIRDDTIITVSIWNNDTKFMIGIYDEKLLPKLLELFPGDDTIINIK